MRQKCEKGSMRYIQMSDGANIHRHAWDMENEMRPLPAKREATSTIHTTESHQLTIFLQGRVHQVHHAYADAKHRSSRMHPQHLLLNFKREHCHVCPRDHLAHTCICGKVITQRLDLDVRSCCWYTSEGLCMQYIVHDRHIQNRLIG